MTRLTYYLHFDKMFKICFRKKYKKKSQNSKCLRLGEQKMFIQKWHAHMYSVFYFKSFINDLTELCISLSNDFKLMKYS